MFLLRTEGPHTGAPSPNCSGFGVRRRRERSWLWEPRPMTLVGSGGPSARSPSGTGQSVILTEEQKLSREKPLGKASSFWGRLEIINLVLLQDIYGTERVLKGSLQRCFTHPAVL